MKNQKFTENSDITRSKEMPTTTAEVTKKKKKSNKGKGSSERTRTVRMDREILNKVKIEAIQQDTTMKDYLEELVRKDLGLGN